MSDITVSPVRGRAGIEAWLEVPRLIFQDDPAWIQPLDHVERVRLSRSKNPFFRHAECELFLAWLDGRPVGRISAQINRLFVERHGEPTGHFGFLQTIDDVRVTKALTDAAAGWLSARGMTRMSGPFNFSINDECGLLVEGFTAPPRIAMPHARQWQSRHVEHCGLTGEMDLHAFLLKEQSAFDRLDRRLASERAKVSNVTVRSLEPQRLDAELAVMVDIFNDAWHDNWGFVPLHVSDLKFAIGDLRPFIRAEFGRFVLLDGEPVGFDFCIPDVNEIIAPFGGRLLPFNWLKMIVALTRNNYSSGRIALMGLRKSAQGGRRGTAIISKLIGSRMQAVAEHQRKVGRGPIKIEMSWVLSTNTPLLSFLKAAFGNPSKTYRIYGKSLAKSDQAHPVLDDQPA